MEQKSALTSAQLQQLHSTQKQLKEEQLLSLATRPSPPEFDKVFLHLIPNHPILAVDTFTGKFS